MPAYPYRETKRPIRAQNLPGSVPPRPMSAFNGEPTVPPMSLTASLDDSSVTAAPGEETALPLRILNSGSTVEEYRFEVVGACAAWSTVEAGDALPVSGRLADGLPRTASAPGLDGARGGHALRDTSGADQRTRRHGGARRAGDRTPLHRDDRRTGAAQLARSLARQAPARRRQPGQRPGHRTAGGPVGHGAGTGLVRRGHPADRARTGGFREGAHPACQARVARHPGHAPLPAGRHPGRGRGPGPGRTGGRGRHVPAGADPAALAPPRTDHRGRAADRAGGTLVRAAAPGREVGGPRGDHPGRGTVRRRGRQEQGAREGVLGRRVGRR